MERSQDSVIHGTLSSAPAHRRVKFPIYFFPCDLHLSESLLGTVGDSAIAKEPVTKQSVWAVQWFNRVGCPAYVIILIPVHPQNSAGISHLLLFFFF